MGSDLSKYSRTLVSQNPPIVAVDPRFALPQPLTLVMNENFFSFSGDDFSIIDAQTGGPFFRIDGQAFSLSQTKILVDAYGNPVANFKHRIFDVFQRHFDVYQGVDESQPLFTIQVESGMASKLTAQVRNLVTGQIHNIVLIGDFSMDATIFNGHPKEGGVAIANLFRPHNIAQKSMFHVSIAPGVDAALIVFLVLALDEARSDHHENHAARMGVPPGMAPFMMGGSGMGHHHHHHHRHGRH